MAVYARQTSGLMAETYACGIQWHDGKETKAYVKRFSNVRKLALVNEVTGYIIAKQCGLPVPRFAGLINTSAEQFDDESAQYNNWAFVVSSLEGTTPGSFYEVQDMQSCKSLMNLVAGWDKVSDAIAFDDWVANEDRHLGNIMVAGKNRIYLFDHSNLPITLNWQAHQLDPNYVAKSVLTDNLYALNCTPLPVKSMVAHATNTHEDVYNMVKQELCYWWDVLLEGDVERRVALEKFMESRAILGNRRVCGSLRMLA
ncbi:HipA family kinase [Shewanella sp.]|uniref:HipA family kinase n=1 Tax=Shewanella sp. TaxID=50422 RepID=UPI001EC562DA|nr:HipA family kinase [Shewanella sp.]NRB25989.1 hypothetical protein [Shewanella sp.]